MIYLELLILGFCAALWAPDTFVGKTLRQVLVDAPLNAYRRAAPLKLVAGLFVLLGLVLIVVVAPEWIALFGLGDIAAYLDVGVLLLLINAVGRLKFAYARLAFFARRLRAHVVSRRTPMRGRSRASRPRKPKTPPADDDSDAEWVWAFAMAPCAA